MRKVISSYTAVLVVLVIFSYGFIDSNFPYASPQQLHNLVYIHRPIATVIYVAILLFAFIFYIYFLRRIQMKHITTMTVWRLVGVTSGILIFAYPGFSNDIFNYIATAKVVFLYGENPYIVMPVDISVEPMLAYLHAANKTALYGMPWIALTAIPHFLSFGSILGAIIAFKLFIAVFYLGLSYLIYLFSNRSAFALAFFALNPLVVIESLVSSHNDVVMMFFAVLSMYLLSKKFFVGSIVAIIFSIGIKYATIVLTPVYCYEFYKMLKKETPYWDGVWKYSAILLSVVFLLSPIREELYSWYFIWPMTFIALLPGWKLVREVAVALSFGMLLRFAPYVYTREWFGITPTIKFIVTTAPFGLLALWRLAKR